MLLKNSGQSCLTTVMSCICYPICVPYLRYKVRKDQGIDVRFLFWLILSFFK